MSEEDRVERLRALVARQVQRCLEAAGAFWIYPGAPKKDVPHALLTSDKHFDGYVDVGRVLKSSPETRMVFAKNIIAILRQVWAGRINRVVGADTSSTALAEDVASIVGVRHISRHIRMVRTENEQGKKQVWHENNLPLRDGESVLHIEESVTTTSSALQVREGIRIANPGVQINFIPFLPVVVERSDPDNRVTMLEDSRILSLLQLCIRNYDPDPEHCPYCKVGSQALRPKEGDNWLKLTGRA